MSSESTQDCGMDGMAPISIAVSSRAIFDLEEENDVFDNQSMEDYFELHHSRVNTINLGTASHFVKALGLVNEEWKKLNKCGKARDAFKIVLMSRNSAECDVGIRLIRGAKAHGLPINRMCLAGGNSPVNYLEAYNISLFLTANSDDVQEALSRGFPAAHLQPQRINPPPDDELRVAFDLDCTLFGSESEDVFKTQGLKSFVEHEVTHVNKDIGKGPLEKFAMQLSKVYQEFRAGVTAGKLKKNPIRMYIVTSRGATEGERALLTLQKWGLDMNEGHFLDGMSKDSVLKVIRPHIFFDDQMTHIKAAQGVGAPAGHVLPTFK